MILTTANPQASYRAHQAEIDAAILAVLDSPAHILGPVVQKLEKSLAAQVGVEHCIAVNSGTDALHLGLRAIGVTAGDEVITASHTAVATVAAIEMSGAIPRFVDVEEPWLTIDPDAVSAAVTSRTRALVAVHLYGQPTNLTRLMGICERHGIALVEDCAQSQGALWENKPVGRFGSVGCFSFYPTKNLGTVGDGGMSATHDADVAARLRSLRQYGWNEPQYSLEPGWNSRLGPLQAAIITVKLAHLEDMVMERRRIAQRYSEAFAGLPIRCPRDRPDARHAYNLYVIRCETSTVRKNLQAFLADHGTMAMVHYSTPVHRQPAYQTRFHTCPLPVTERASGEILSLPLYPELEEKDQERVIAAVREFFGQGRCD